MHEAANALIRVHKASTQNQKLRTKTSKISMSQRDNRKSCHSDQLHHQGADRLQLSANAHQLERRPVHKPIVVARKRLPVDAREEYGKLYRARFEGASFSAGRRGGTRPQISS